MARGRASHLDEPAILIALSVAYGREARSGRHTPHTGASLSDLRKRSGVRDHDRCHGCRYTSTTPDEN